jgi:uncharacterized protein YndB with AHSA1/START domain
MSAAVALMTRRTIAADVKRVFEAWTRPEHLRAWWGPRPVRCSEAEVDLRIGGHYRIVNDLPDGSHIVIEGMFTAIEPPTKLVYTWNVSPGPETTEVVTVMFEARGDTTEVIVVHEHIATQAQRDSHEEGWIGCLDGLERFFAR